VKPSPDSSSKPGPRNPTGCLRLSSVLGFLAFLALSALSADLTQLERELEDRRSELARTQEQLDEAMQRIEQLSESEQAGLARIEALDDQVATARRYLSQLDDQLSALTREIAEVSDRCDKTKVSIEARKEELAANLINIYKHGLLVPLDVVLSAKKVTDMHRRLAQLRWVSRAERRSAEELQVLRAEHLGQRSRLLAARDELDRLRDERVRKEITLTSSLKAESAILSKMRAERRIQQELEGQLEEAKEHLRSLVSALEYQRSQQAVAGGHFFEKNKGRLPWPVQGKLVAAFGSQVHPQYKTRTNNSGIDIKVEPGVAALAIAQGKVAYADHFLGYGRLVILDHGGGFYTLYGNLDKITAGLGKEIEQGSPIGLAKEQLHFEIRREGQPVDPLLWLEPR